ncbi:hypothetical protein KO465_05365 [Candidatus Micrarchaeota archaeon]|nr:hypothetical protein [Candidatus Micrarchaeota archaeon]
MALKPILNSSLHTNEKNAVEIKNNETLIIFYMSRWLALNDKKINENRFFEVTGKELKQCNFSTVEDSKLLDRYSQYRFDEIMGRFSEEKILEYVASLQPEEQAFAFVSVLLKGREAYTFIKECEKNPPENFSESINQKFDIFWHNELVSMRQYNYWKTKKITISRVAEFIENAMPEYLNTLTTVYGILMGRFEKEDQDFVDAVKQADEIMKKHNLLSNDIELNAQRIARLTISVFIRGPKRAERILKRNKYKPEDIRGPKFLFIKSKLRFNIEGFEDAFAQFDKTVEEIPQPSPPAPKPSPTARPPVKKPQPVSVADVREARLMLYDRIMEEESDADSKSVLKERGNEIYIREKFGNFVEFLRNRGVSKKVFDEEILNTLDEIARCETMRCFSNLIDGKIETYFKRQ